MWISISIMQQYFHPSTHLVLFVLERDFEGLSCTDHGLHWSEDVLVDQFGEALLILICVAWPMDYSHLLDEGALATLSSTLTGTRRHRKLAETTEIASMWNCWQCKKTQLTWPRNKIESYSILQCWPTVVRKKRENKMRNGDNSCVQIHWENLSVSCENC